MTTRTSTSTTRSRWLAKKTLRRGVALGSLLSGSLLARRALSPGPSVRALTYHRFGAISRDPFCVSLEAFDAQMAWLARSGRAISLGDLEAFLAGERGVPDGAVLVTIDDGYRSTHSGALPILRRHGIPAVAFVSVGFIGSDGGADDPEPYMSWDELLELAGSDVAVASHALSHRSFGTLDRDEARREGARSRELLESRLGAPVRAFAYPFGTAAHHSPLSAEVLSNECGYTSLFLSEHGPIHRDDDRRLLRRVKVESGEGLPMFELLCRGALDPWVVVDRHLWRTGHALARARSLLESGSA